MSHAGAKKPYQVWVGKCRVPTLLRAAGNGIVVGSRVALLPPDRVVAAAKGLHGSLSRRARPTPGHHRRMGGRCGRCREATGGRRRGGDEGRGRVSPTAVGDHTTPEKNGPGSDEAFGWLVGQRTTERGQRDRRTAINNTRAEKGRQPSPVVDVNSPGFEESQKAACGRLGGGWGRAVQSCSASPR
jgi:hypothetical protein